MAVPKTRLVASRGRYDLMVSTTASSWRVREPKGSFEGRPRAVMLDATLRLYATHTLNLSENSSL
jgi:hypothetical protein